MDREAFRSGDMAISGKSRAPKSRRRSVRAQQAVWGTSVEISRESGPNSVSLGRSRFIADERRWPHLLWSCAGSFSGLRAMGTLQGEAPDGDTVDRLLRHFAGVPMKSRLHARSDPSQRVKALAANSPISGSITVACARCSRNPRSRARRCSAGEPWAVAHAGGDACH